MKNKQINNQPLVRYSPASNAGLTLTQVNERIRTSQVNLVKSKNSKSYLNIFVNNV
jgi:hypothetical protein